MRFNLELSDSDPKSSSSITPYASSPSTPHDQLQWLPLQHHPVFSTATATSAAAAAAADAGVSNLMAWDGASRIYFWDSEKEYLHRISIRLGEPDPASVIAASPSKVLRADIELDFVVSKISINRSGSVLFLAGSQCTYAMYLYGSRSAKDNSVICRTVPVGSEVFHNTSNAIRLLQVTWHPYSDMHLAVLSSDSVFRIFDLSSAPGLLEQEYYLQPVEPGRSRNASSICPVDFCFGQDHLWDRFSAFVLFSDGSIYVLCPVAPFGSVYTWESIMEIYSDAQTFGLRSDNSTAVSNSSLAISWLEATFPELNQGKETSRISAVKVHPYVVIDASVSLQGPLCKICHGEEDDRGLSFAECDGRAVSFLYNSVGKDLILVTAWSGGQLQIVALADEIQPIWHTKNSPRLSLDSHDQIQGFAMICESSADKLSVVRLGLPVDNNDWLGHPPPLLRLAIVDLALPGNKDGDSTVSMFIDPLIPERIYCLHVSGVDSVVLHFLPFTNQNYAFDETLRTPSVHPILSTCQGATASSLFLCGFVVLSDSFGYSWIAGVTSTRECIVLEMKTWNILLPKCMDTDIKPAKYAEAAERITPDIISRELLAGPQVVIVPQGSNLQLVAADSIEGRSTLHQYFKLFHENYVEYAHKVYFELKHHGPHVKKIIDSMQTRLHDSQKKLMDIEEKQPKLNHRITRAIERHESLEERLHKLRRLPGIHKKPLTRAESEFKSELGVEISSSTKEGQQAEDVEGGKGGEVEMTEVPPHDEEPVEASETNLVEGEKGKEKEERKEEHRAKEPIETPQQSHEEVITSMDYSIEKEVEKEKMSTETPRPTFEAADVSMETSIDQMNLASGITKNLALKELDKGNTKAVESPESTQEKTTLDAGINTLDFEECKGEIDSLLESLKSNPMEFTKFDTLRDLITKLLSYPQLSSMPLVVKKLQPCVQEIEILEQTLKTSASYAQSLEKAIKTKNSHLQNAKEIGERAKAALTQRDEKDAQAQQLEVEIKNLETQITKLIVELVSKQQLLTQTSQQRDTLDVEATQLSAKHNNLVSSLTKVKESSLDALLQKVLMEADLEAQLIKIFKYQLVFRSLY